MQRLQECFSVNTTDNAGLKYGLLKDMAVEASMRFRTSVLRKFMIPLGYSL